MNHSRRKHLGFEKSQGTTDVGDRHRSVGVDLVISN